MRKFAVLFLLGVSVCATVTSEYQTGLLTVPVPLPAYNYAHDSFEDYVVKVRAFCREHSLRPLSRRFMRHFTLTQQNCLIFGRRLYILRMMEKINEPENYAVDSVKATNIMQHGAFHVHSSKAMAMMEHMPRCNHTLLSIVNRIGISTLQIVLSKDEKKLSAEVVQLIIFLTNNAPHIQVTLAFEEFTWLTSVTMTSGAGKCIIRSQQAQKVVAAYLMLQ